MSCKISLADRYKSAAAHLGPNIAAGVKGLWIEGAWVGDKHFFYVTSVANESAEPSHYLPHILDVYTGERRAVISEPALRSALGLNKADEIRVAQFDIPEHGKLVVHLHHESWLLDLESGLPIDSRKHSNEPKLWSPDSRKAIFVRDSNLWQYDEERRSERQITTDGCEAFEYAQHPDGAGFPISKRAAPQPLGIWSSDSRWFVTHQIDERNLPEALLAVDALDVPAALRTFRHPTPKSDVARGHIVALDTQTHAVFRFGDFPFVVTGGSPLASERIWFSSSTKLWFLRSDRYSKNVELIEFDLTTRKVRPIYEERVPHAYFDANLFRHREPNVRILEDGEAFIWFSERTGNGHLYLHDTRTGRLRSTLTQGDFQVCQIVNVDECQRRMLLLISGLPSSDRAHRQLAAVNLDDGSLELLTHHEGDVAVLRNAHASETPNRPWKTRRGLYAVNEAQDCVVLRKGSKTGPSSMEILDVNSGASACICRQQEPLPKVAQLPFQLMAADGLSTLTGNIYLPSHFDERDTYPLIAYCYSGPHVNLVGQTFPALKNAHAMALAELGFVTFVLDPRGTPFGSEGFRKASYGTLIKPQMADHVCAIEQLADRFSYIDRRRVGIIGQSAGGAVAAECLFQYEDTFKSAVAVCGCFYPSDYLADWADTYLGPDAGDYRIVHPRRFNGSGKLLLIGAVLDDNVLVSQTYRLSGELIEAGHEFDEIIVPGYGHDVLNISQDVVFRVWDHFVRTLQEVDPPNYQPCEYSAEKIMHYSWARSVEASL